MAGLEGTVKTPFGTVEKKTALIVGGGIVVLGAIVWYRQRQLGDTPDASATGETAINPATGYPYGSPEDAAALAAQSAYVSPTVDGGGGSNIPPAGVGYASNGQWVQGVIAYMTNNSLIEEPSALSAALGKYITGAYVPPGSTDDSLIQQAIAVQGYPPLSGGTGYPPSINRTPPTSTPPTTTPKPNPNPRGYGWYKVVKGDNAKKVAAKFNTTVAALNTWNGSDAYRIGEWIKVRSTANPTVGYNGVK